MVVETLIPIGVRKDTQRNQTPNAMPTIPGVSIRAIRFVYERETAQTVG